jgi:hypothetical protein
MVLIWLVLVVAIGWAAHYVIRTFMPPGIQTPILLLVGVVLLIILLWALMGPLGLVGRRSLP